MFGSVQSLSQMDFDRLKPDAFDVVIVDEFHHAGAPTYKKLLGHLKPKVLLGLTATPERTDSEDILHYFDGHIAAEMRLWDALERNLVCPFQYFGVHDNSDLSSIRWTRAGYDVSQLEKLYTGNDARVAMVLQQLQDKLRDVRTMRALGFCVSIAHAEFMARKFTAAGLPSLAVSANTDSDDRKQALLDLRAGRIRALFAVDLFNEGVDLPEVDTLLFLRPTESALVFLQQLGRGLRRFEGKDCVTVLDFIGQAHRQFRFDLRYRAVTGATRTEVEKQIEQGFPFLPAGCSMQLDRVATDIVLKNIRSAIPSRRPAMERELRALLASDQYRGRVPSLREFLDETGLEVGGRLQVRLLVRPEAGGRRGDARGRPARGEAGRRHRAAAPRGGPAADRGLHERPRVTCGGGPRRAHAPAPGGPALRPDAVPIWPRTRWRTRSGCSTRTRPSSRRLASCCRCWTTSPTTSPIRWTKSWGGRTASRSRCTRATPCGTSSPPSASLRWAAPPTSRRGCSATSARTATCSS